MSNQNCIFCQIINGEAEASFVYEDELVVAFMDLHPINPGHTLIIPRHHAPHLADMDGDTGAHLFRVTQRIVAAVRQSGVRCEGVNLFLADGEAAYQDVFHVHMHVIPRFHGDPFRIDANWNNNPPRSELHAVAERIKANLP